MGSSTNQPKDNWDKTAVVLAPLGGLFTALSVAIVGFFGTRYLNSLQEADNRQRVYAELITKREEADVQLRKDMLNSIITTFITSHTEDPAQSVLKLELLAYNFHDALDLAPLFKQVYRQIDPQGKSEEVHLLDRLQRVAHVIVGRQIAVLNEPGFKQQASIDLERFDQHPEGITIYDGEMSLRAPRTEDRTRLDYQPRPFVVEVMRPNPKTKELQVRLRVSRPKSKDVTNDPEVDKVLWVGLFDFPMIDNTRLSHDQRCAIILNDFDSESHLAEITIIYFPGDRASLKERPYFHEVLENLRRAAENSSDQD